MESIKKIFAECLVAQWSHLSRWHLFLLPLSWLFRMCVKARQFLYQFGLIKSYALSVPVVVVGNISVGGTGKTPLVIYLVEQFQALGLKPGVISRGYGGTQSKSTIVDQDSDSAIVGDEPILIAKRTGCPVFVGKDRVATAKALMASYPACDIVISDDGLQHYRLKRDLEISVIDGNVAFGNNALLPAGPLREPINRLNSVDLLVVNGLWQGAFRLEDVTKTQAFNMELKADDFYHLEEANSYAKAADFFGKEITAIAGIGNPERFFEELEALGLMFKRKSFPDHYQYQAEDFKHIQSEIVLMTEKDAVKCQALKNDRFWVLPVSARLDEQFIPTILEKLAT